MLLFLSTGIFSCGWLPSRAGQVLLYRIMPLDESQYSSYEDITIDYLFHGSVDYEKETIELWKHETSSEINSEDIRAIVYKSDVDFLRNMKKASDKNTFVQWLVNHKRNDIIDYLILAKQCEDVVSSMSDPWYYGVSGDKQSLMLKNIVKRCRAYKSGPLFGRYVLQLLRALCAQRKYEECVDVWRKNESLLKHNVVRTMAELKAAGALNKIGEKQEALKIYTKYGDVSSIRTLNDGKIKNELEFVYKLQPNSSYIPGELQKWLVFFGGDWSRNAYASAGVYSERINNIIKVGKKAIRNQKVKDKAMWYYTLAAFYDVKGESKKALVYLRRGDSYPKTSFLRDSYRVLRMYLEAKTVVYDAAYEHKLFVDLKWLVSKIEKEKPVDFLQKMDPNHTCPYSIDGFLYMGYQDTPNSFYWNDALRRIVLREICPRMHKARRFVREVQLANMAENLLLQINEYSNEMFQIMDRLSYLQTKYYFYRIYHPQDAFDVFLNSRGKTDKFYWYDILGTKCLREQRYSKAVVYLRQVPLSFQKKMAEYGYMDKDPFSYDKETFKSMPALARNYKLHFAQKMAHYQLMMNSHQNSNVRADAKILYAMGLRNSVYRCWFLTRYSSNWDNSYVKEQLPAIEYPSDSSIYCCERYKKLSDKLINQAIHTYRNKEKAAQQLRKLLYFKRILDRYGNTETARDIRRHCDRWRDYVSCL